MSERQALPGLFSRIRRRGLLYLDGMARVLRFSTEFHRNQPRLSNKVTMAIAKHPGSPGMRYTTLRLIATLSGPFSHILSRGLSAPSLRARNAIQTVQSLNCKPRSVPSPARGGGLGWGPPPTKLLSAMPSSKSKPGFPPARE